MLNVLWLCSWYPSRVSPDNGDFIERHAIAMAPFVQLTLLFIEKDETLPNRAVDIKKTEENGYTIYRVGYGRSGSAGILEKLFSFRRYRRLQREVYAQIEQERGRPQVVHVHVALKAGLLALWLKKKEHLPYIVTEHWTGYYPQSVPNIYHTNRLLRQAAKNILGGASLVLPVSVALGKTIARHFADVPFRAVPNVVDTSVFYYKERPAARFRFIHVSYMNYQKNPEGILQAAVILKNKGLDFEIAMIGNDGRHLSDLVQQLGLGTHVHFEAAIPYPAVAARMQEADAFVLFSRFENLPCVILEALCCGLPVVSTDTGGIAEVITEENGLLVQSESVPQLAEAMETLLSQYQRYKRQEISAKAMAQFNYHTIGKKHLSIYHSLGAKA